MLETFVGSLTAMDSLAPPPFEAEVPESVDLARLTRQMRNKNIRDARMKATEKQRAAAASARQTTGPYGTPRMRP